MTEEREDSSHLCCRIALMMYLDVFCFLAVSMACTSKLVSQSLAEWALIQFNSEYASSQLCLAQENPDALFSAGCIALYSFRAEHLRSHPGYSCQTNTNFLRTMAAALSSLGGDKGSSGGNLPHGATSGGSAFHPGDSPGARGFKMAKNQLKLRLAMCANSRAGSMNLGLWALDSK